LCLQLDAPRVQPFVSRFRIYWKYIAAMHRFKRCMAVCLLRLRRPMSGKALPFRQVTKLIGGYASLWRLSRRKLLAGTERQSLSAHRRAKPEEKRATERSLVSAHRRA